MILLNLFLLLLIPICAWSPTNSYAPGKVQCPSYPLLREANNISDAETQWLKKRDEVTKESIQNYLKYSAKFTDGEISQVLDDQSTIRLAVAFSGGGFRAMLVGAGQTAALDNRTVGAFENGLGGVLQSTTYYAGLSGSAWLVGTLAMNNWTSMQSILDERKIWNTNKAIYASKGHNGIKNTGQYLNWIGQISKKKAAGFKVTFIDFWARCTSTMFFDKSSKYGLANTWSGLLETPVFQNGQMPLPIVVANTQYKDKLEPLENSTVIEITPFEFGTWDDTLRAFSPTKYLGTSVDNGVPINNTCYAGFDNGGFIMAAASDTFALSFSLLQNSIQRTINIFALMFKKMLKITDRSDFFKAVFPNPFKNSPFGNSKLLTSLKRLPLIDAGGDLQDIPFGPLTIKHRNVDLILAFDISKDTKDVWPDGSALVKTYERQLYNRSDYAFPYVPPTSTFIAKGYNKKPIFFGCDAKNLTELNHIPPIVAYLPNRKYTFASNTGTGKLTYNFREKYGMLQNGFETATRFNLTEDSSWKTCMGCAMIKRSQERKGIAPSEDCQRCFNTYCWDGKV